MARHEVRVAASLDEPSTNVRHFWTSRGGRWGVGWGYPDEDEALREAAKSGADEVELYHGDSRRPYTRYIVVRTQGTVHYEKQDN